MTPEQRLASILSRCEPDANGCLVWTGGVNSSGYANVTWREIRYVAHRLVWILHYGAPDSGLDIDHTCEQKLCMNIDHLRLVTHRENILRSRSSPFAIRARQVACVHGHPFDEANTIVRPDGTRACRACKRKRNAARRRVL